MNKELSWFIAVATFFIICMSLTSYVESKETQFKIDMANSGLEQCVNPHSKYQGNEVIWVRNCPEHLK